ncbi:MAG: endonuclease III [Candidatus Pacearchaeota archaeon]
MGEPNKYLVIKQLKKLKEYSKNIKLAAEGWGSDYKTLISTILSARTRDEITINVAKILFLKYPSIEKLSKEKPENIEKIIKPVNFYKTKAKNIINCAKILYRKYNSKVPHDFKTLISLPGVGRKTANVFLAEIGKDEIGVDTHVSQISRFLEWTKNTEPKKIELDLKNLFPKKYWKEINPILVRFGKSYTKKREKYEILTKIKKMR